MVGLVRKFSILGVVLSAACSVPSPASDVWPTEQLIPPSTSGSRDAGAAIEGTPDRADPLEEVDGAGPATTDASLGGVDAGGDETDAAEQVDSEGLDAGRDGPGVDAIAWDAARVDAGFPSDAQSRDAAQTFPGPPPPTPSADGCTATLSCSSTVTYRKCANYHSGTGRCERAYYTTNFGNVIDCASCGDCRVADRDLDTVCRTGTQPSGGLTCGPPVVCNPRGTTYRQCYRLDARGTCEHFEYQMGDGRVFPCASCSQCQSAATSATNACR